ncbi:hypothetical protein [Nocardioides sp.]|uniref:hypothetical protein n=1 Tax=Nocardioides sp. TaxID=35761 RepID=UPI00272309E9|nr:hypothetical protein [Nocardioides sp.]MDO9455010.1 hypothetical protein [Nocardioides sp.]
MDRTTAEQAARRVGWTTLPIGLGLLVAPSPVAALLGDGAHDAALRAIAVCDLALVPGLVGGHRPPTWLAARVALNLGIAGYCLHLARDGARGPRVGVAAMVVASVADVRTAMALRRTAIQTTPPTP